MSTLSRWCPLMANNMMPKCGNCFLSFPNFSRIESNLPFWTSKSKLTSLSLKMPFFFLTMILLSKSCDTFQPPLFICSLSHFATKPLQFPIVTYFVFFLHPLGKEELLAIWCSSSGVYLIKMIMIQNYLSLSLHISSFFVRKMSHTYIISFFMFLKHIH